ncbi:hypothetical protein DLM76_10230 [Leptospira yasudae]|uniref:Uncharacterized protein n=1 Tax=Leptospira yasudae TaxID=2202201 RepID=A0ABX9M4Y2_9LEPT|nr:hypothetical protein DLM77_07540 [Leptospira yasudae]RHX94446.1 hypothetical protein DLM76_10230 [Leptospira yasudae]
MNRIQRKFRQFCRKTCAPHPDFGWGVGGGNSPGTFLYQKNLTSAIEKGGSCRNLGFFSKNDACGNSFPFCNSKRCL